MTTDIAPAIAEAHRWQRRLGNTVTAAPHCHIVANPSFPDVWEANHADEVTAETEAEIDAVFAAMDVHLAHTPWRIVHTDGFTPDAFLARLALDDFEEKFVAIQMALHGDLAQSGGPIDLRPVLTDADWGQLLELVLVDHAEGRRTGGMTLPPEFTEKMVASYRSKSADFHFHLAFAGADPVAYGACAIAPNGVGMIDDLFTLSSARRRGVATAMISAFTDRLRSGGCKTIFLGALPGETAKRLYARLGFHPVGLTRTWVWERTDSD
jgi:GNAT superfamily N-acetyltransferase